MLHASVRAVAEVAGGPNHIHLALKSVLTSEGTHVFMLLGGLHLVKTSDPEIERLANALHDKWKIDRMAPGHCTGEPAIAKLK